MSKATRIINKYHIKEMLLNGNPQFENFYKEDLIKFCEVAEELIKENNRENQQLKEQNERLSELCMYALISSTKIYNHELAIDTKKSFIDIIRNNLNYDTYTLRNKLLEAWRSEK